MIRAELLILGGTVRRLALIRSLILLSLLALGAGSQAHAAGNSVFIPPGWPRLLSAPAIGINRAPVESLALTRPTDAEAPYKWGDVAWYNRSPKPGDQGRAIIYGHLDSFCCPAIFYRLQFLKKGSIVQVGYPDGKWLDFMVQWNATYWNNQLPTNFMYANTNERGILLVTCAGAFHRDGTGYDHKRIVYATLLRLPPSHPRTPG
jgi:sortase (surface protein transpeptidase)